jgi:hypothetical protein
MQSVELAAAPPFSMVCADGSLLTANFDEAGNAQLTRGHPFFDAKNDPVFEHPGFSRHPGVACSRNCARRACLPMMTTA